MSINSDLLMLIHDEDTVRGMEVMQSGTHVLVDRLGVPSEIACELLGKFGPSCICNIVGAIKTAKYLGLGPDDNVVTIATDSYDRYPSVSQALYARNGGKPTDDQLEMWAKSVFLGASLGEIVDLNQPGQHERLQQMKADLWTRFGYSAGVHPPDGRPGILGRRVRQDQGDRPADRRGAWGNITDQEIDRGLDWIRRIFTDFGSVFIRLIRQIRGLLSLTHRNPLLPKTGQTGKPFETMHGCRVQCLPATQRRPTTFPPLVNHPMTN